MGMVVRTNTMAINANRQLGVNNSAVAKSLEKLASGFRINRAGDDASGLAISEKMKAQIKGLEQASANSQDGISLIQTAEGALTEVHNMLNRMVELATKSANGTIQNEVDREAIQAEVDALTTEITRISKATNFNGINLLDGSLATLDTSIFTVGTSVAAVEGQSVDLSALFAPSTEADKTKLHLGTEAITQVAPEFKVDLGDLTLDTTGATADNSKLKFNIAGTDYELAAVAKDQQQTTTEIRDALLTAFNTVNTATADKAGNKVVNIGGAYFKAEADGATGIKFTYAGLAANTTNAQPTDEMSDTVADAVNALLSDEFTVDKTGVDATAAGTAGDIMHDNINVKNAVAKVEGGRAGIDLTIDNTVVADGNRLTIDGTTFVFKTDADSAVSAGSGEVLIDVSGFKQADGTWDETEAIQQAIDMISQNETTNFKLEAKSGTVLHIDQKVGSTETYDTYEKLTGVVSAKTAGSAAYTPLTIADNTKIEEDDVITIGNKRYTFGTGDGKVAIGKDATETLNNLKTALEADGMGATVSGNTIQITSGTTAPVISSGGLTLQVGDTNDDFNKVTVSVDNLSAKGLNLLDDNGQLNVLSQDAAGNAIQTIKNAINQVSTNRANMGALQNRLEYTINNLDTTAENMTAANSRIRDTDMAKEMMNYTKMNILTQAAQAMLAQANQQPQAILQLLQ